MRRSSRASARPTSTEAQRDVSVSLDNLGDMALEAGDLAGARARYEEDLAIARRLAQANPISAQAQRDLGISLNKLGNVAVQAGDLAGARARYEEDLGIARKLAQANPTSAEAQRDVSVSLNKLGNVAMRAGDLAVRQRAGDGLRSYLRSYPDGAHADEARTRLAGCTIERAETRGPEKDVRFTLTVSQGGALPTEADARRDAVERGNRDAATTCAPQRMVADLRSAVAEARTWRCAPRDGGVVCGFDGEIVCRVRDRIRADQERCRGEHE